MSGIGEQPWFLSDRADPPARRIADRHYNRQKIGSPQFVPPGRCLVMLTAAADALWVTSWPFPEYVQHAWAGAMVNSLFRREPQCPHLASDLIIAATAATRAHWPDLPDLGIVSFVDAEKTRRKRDPGRCYRRAGWTHVGFTKGGLWVFQLLPADFPDPAPVQELQGSLFGVASLTTDPRTWRRNASLALAVPNTQRLVQGHPGRESATGSGRDGRTDQERIDGGCGTCETKAGRSSRRRDAAELAMDPPPLGTPALRARVGKR